MSKMSRVQSRFVSSVVLFTISLVPYLVRGQEAWKAGSSRVNITPSRYMCMSGYGSRTAPADGKYSDLWAKALVLEDPRGSRGILVAMDLIGMDRTLSRSVCQALQEGAGVQRSQIALCFSHTHTGPVVGRNLEPLHYRQVDSDQRALIEQYAQTLPKALVQCVNEAVEALEPCTPAWGSGSATFAVNRRNNPEREVPRLREQNGLTGPVDHDVPVLAIRSPSGCLKAIVFGYACHATVLSDTKWSGDYPGFAQSELERNHPGTTAIFWAGCGADQNPLPRRKLELAQEYGRQLAQAVDDVLATDMEAVGESLSTSFREVPLPLDTLPTKDQLVEESQSENRFVRARASMLLERLEAGQVLEKTYPYPIAVWKLGDQVEWVFLGGEVVVDFARRFKRELHGPQTWVAGYCHDVMAYIPSLRVLGEGGYEGAGAMVYYGLPTAWAPEVEQVIRDEVYSMVSGRR